MAFDNIQEQMGGQGPAHETLLDACWAALEEGAADRDSPWWTTTFFSASDEGANARTVILRAADRDSRRLTFYTDFRSPKVHELGGRVGFVSHDRARGVQLRLRGSAVLHHQDARARQVWTGMGTWQQLAYLKEPAPGTEVDAPFGVLAHRFESRERTVEEIDEAFQSFVVIDVAIDHLDWLFLTDDGNRAASFDWADHGTMRAAWLVP